MNKNIGQTEPTNVGPDVLRTHVIHPDRRSFSWIDSAAAGIGIRETMKLHPGLSENRSNPASDKAPGASQPNAFRIHATWPDLSSGNKARPHPGPLPPEREKLTHVSQKLITRRFTPAWANGAPSP